MTSDIVSAYFASKLICKHENVLKIKCLWVISLSASLLKLSSLCDRDFILYNILLSYRKKYFIYKSIYYTATYLSVICTQTIQPLTLLSHKKQLKWKVSNELESKFLRTLYWICMFLELLTFLTDCMQMIKRILCRSASP